MNLDQRQTALIHTPVGMGLAALMNDSEGDGTGGLGESADRLVLAPPESLDPQQIERQGLKGTARLGDTQAAGAEKGENGKLPGLKGLKGLSAECDEASKPATWRDNLMVPEPPPTNVRKMAVGISGGAVAGVLVCVLALQFMRSSTANRSPQPIPSGQKVVQGGSPIDVKARETAQKGSPDKQLANSGEFPAKGGREELPGDSTPASRLKSRLTPEILFRLELSQEQAARIRIILERCSKDLPFAEGQIRGLLTEEQNRQWQAIAP